MCQHLHAIANSKDGQTAFVYIERSQWGAFLVDAGRATGEDESFRLESRDSLPGGIVGDELTIDVAFANSAGDEVAILGAEIDDGNCFLGWGYCLWRGKLLAMQFFGDLQVGGDFDIVASGYTVSLCFVSHVLGWLLKYIIAWRGVFVLQGMILLLW
jgi:hypothetical protein